MRSYFLTLGQILHKAPPPRTCPFCGRTLLEGPSKVLLYCEACNEIATWFPLHLAYTLVGDSGTGKSLWLYQIADYYLNHTPRQRCVFVSLDDLPAHVREHASPYIANLSDHEARGDLVIVDGYSSIAGTRSEERYAPASMKDLDALSEILTRLLGEGFRLFIIDSLTPLTAVTNPNALARDLVTLTAKLKSSGATLFLSTGSKLEGATHLQHFTDALIEFGHSSVTTEDIASLGLSQWLKGVVKPGTTKVPLLAFRFHKARGRPIYKGEIPFVVSEKSIFIALPDDPDAIKRLNEETDRIVQLAPAS